MHRKTGKNYEAGMSLLRFHFRRPHDAFARQVRLVFSVTCNIFLRLQIDSGEFACNRWPARIILILAFVVGSA